MYSLVVIYNILSLHVLSDLCTGATYEPASFEYQDVASEITAELQGFPDFIIGNYSDGNLVASLLAYKMGVTQVNDDSLPFRYSDYKTARSVHTLLQMEADIQNFDVQCTIAHALEKTKYPDSDIYWKKFDEKYNFSCQFTADLIAMNNADFIITSTYQEIAGS